MTDVTLERQLPDAPSAVWEALTKPEILAQWWGHDGFTLGPLMEIDFSRTGPWAFEMTSPDGRHFKASGQITHVTPGRSVGFTWSWHDPEDQRGPESHVSIMLEEIGRDGTLLTLRHVDLPGDEAAAGQQRGWGSVLDRLSRIFQP